MLVLPYYYHFDDQFFLLFPLKEPGLSTPMRSRATGGRNSMRNMYVDAASI